MKWRAEGASLLSRGAALECSPGRKPGVNSKPGSQPQRGERFEWIRGILRPYGPGTSTLFHPRACARGYILTALRGWNAQIVIHSHLHREPLRFPEVGGQIFPGITQN